MLKNNYSKTLTIILIIAIVAIVGLLIFAGINWYKAYTTGADSEDFMKEFNEYVNGVQPENTENVEPQNVEPQNLTNEINPVIDLNEIAESNNQSQGNQSSGEGNGNKEITYKGKKVVGTIKIPKINIEYPVLADASASSIEVAIGMLYGPGINQVGNTVLAGHNFKDGTFFSNNKKLAVGDKIQLTDLSGKKVIYEITKKYTTDTNDFSYATRNTNGKREISLTTCTDDTTARLIIWAVEK